MVDFLILAIKLESPFQISLNIWKISASFFAVYVLIVRMYDHGNWMGF
jgi:hypothetical protein